MAAATVIQCQEVSERSGDRDQNTNHRYQREFQVITSDATAGAGTVLDYIQANVANFSNIDTGEPASVYQEDDETGALVYTDLDSVCVSISARQNDKNDLQNWFVTIYYAGLGDPTLEPCQVESGDIKWQEAMIFDLTSPTPLLVGNSAGDPYEAGIMRDRTRITIIVVKNIPDGVWDPVVAAGYKDTLNVDNFGLTWFPTAFRPGTVKLSSLTAIRIQRTDQLSFYWQRKAMFEVDMNGWNGFVHDHGYRSLQTVQTLPVPVVKPVTIIDQFNGTTGIPRLLDGSGNLLPFGSPPVFYPAAGFVRYLTVDWTPLNLEVP